MADVSSLMHDYHNIKPSRSNFLKRRRLLGHLRCSIVRCASKSSTSLSFNQSFFARQMSTRQADGICNVDHLHEQDCQPKLEYHLVPVGNVIARDRVTTGKNSDLHHRNV